MSALTQNHLRQLDLRSKRQSLKISLFGNLMDDFMKCQRLRCIEESRLALEGENSQIEQSQEVILNASPKDVDGKSGRLRF